MIELWLNFRDEKGEPKRILVEQEKFTIGRTSENDLGIPLGNLSRQHARIERFADIFVVSDSGSSNGTTINGAEMKDPVAIKNGDKLNLGGGLEIDVEIVSDEEDANNPGGSANGNSSGDSDKGEASAEDSANAANSGASSASAGAGSGGGSGSLSYFILAPILGIFILLIVGGVLIISSRSTGKTKEISTRGTESGTEDDPPVKSRKSPTPEPEDSSTPVTTQTSTPPGGGTTTPGTTATPFVPEDAPTPKDASESEKVRASSASLLRRIATKDPNAFLTTKQTSIVTDKIKAFKSPAFAENLKDAKKNSAKIQELAKAKGLTPQFLLIAALSDLGNQRGDVVAKATEMSGVLADLSQVLGSELADDSLLVIAAYDQGKAGQFNEMRDLVSKVSDQSTSSSGAVRSIWFLHDNGKISQAQFDRALNFLAVGTITQNPKDFNVSAEAISF